MILLEKQRTNKKDVLQISQVIFVNEVEISRIIEKGIYMLI